MSGRGHVESVDEGGEFGEGRDFGPVDAAHHLAVPGPHDDKYSRGVLGVVTGSARYPGAAVLTVEAALRTGVGMVRYLGPPRAAEFVLQRRPEVVTAPGRVQAWLLGSGMPRPDEDEASDPGIEVVMRQAVTSGLPLVLDAGALAWAHESAGPTVLTPHAGELGRLLGQERSRIEADPVGSARAAAQQFDATVLLKGYRTTIVTARGAALSVQQAPSWLATAGAGDALAGILGALVATHADVVREDPEGLARVAATAAVIHGIAAGAASRGGPFTILDLCAQLGSTIAEMLAQRS